MATAQTEAPELITSVPATARRTPYDALLVVLALGFAVLGLRPLGDPDLWWHLRTGELIVESGFTTSDPWSHASSNSWLLHEWASEVLMYLTYLTGGYRGVVVLHAVGMLVLAVLLLRSVRRSAGPGISAVVGLLSFIALMPGSAERPQLASWCLLAATVPSLRRYVQDRRAPWWLIPVTAVWANVHGLWAAVLVIYGALVLGMIADVGLGLWRIYRSFVLVGAFALAAAALTPNGPELLLAPLHVREYAIFVSEWNPPSLLNPFFGCAYLLVGLLILAWARGTRRVPFTDIALVAAAVQMGLAYIRTIPVLVIIVAPLTAEALHRVSRSPQPRSFLAQPPVARAVSLLAVLAFLAFAVAWLPRLQPIPRHAPWDASATLDALPGRARVLNEYNVGGWLLWTARDTSPAIDGRTEIYSPDYVASAMGAPLMSPGWRKFVKENDFDAAWLGRDAPLVRGLASQGWRVMHRYKNTVIMLPPQAGPRS